MDRPHIVYQALWAMAAFSAAQIGRIPRVSCPRPRLRGERIVPEEMAPRPFCAPSLHPLACR